MLKLKVSKARTPRKKREEKKKLKDWEQVHIWQSKKQNLRSWKSCFVLLAAYGS